MQEIEVVPVQVRFVINTPFKVTAFVIFILVVFLVLITFNPG